MENQIKKSIHFSGNYTAQTTDIIADITTLCEKYRISVDDINLTTFGQKMYQAMISSRHFPHSNHVFWVELFKIAEESNININLDQKEDN